LGCRVQRVQGSGFEDVGFGGFRVKGSGFRVQGSWFREHGRAYDP